MKEEKLSDTSESSIKAHADKVGRLFCIFVNTCPLLFVPRKIARCAKLFVRSFAYKFAPVFRPKSKHTTHTRGGKQTTVIRVLE